MDLNQQRTHALCRDESRNRRALARHQANRYDLDAIRQVHLSVEALLETLGFIVADDRFWTDLSNRAHVLEQREIDALGWFEDGALGALLTACGYHSPPPPPVDQLVEDTRHAVGFALAEKPRPEMIDEARRRLEIFLYRTGRQLEAIEEGPSVGTAPSISRRVGRVARKWIPVVAGMAGGTALESILPSGLWVGGAMGMIGGKVVTKGAEDLSAHLADVAVLAVLGDTLLDPPPYDEQAERWTVATPDLVLSARVAVAQHRLHQLLVDPYRRDPAVVTEIETNLRRVVELSRDHGGPATLESAARLALDALSRWARSTTQTEALRVAVEAVGICVHARGTDSQFAEATYTERPFDDSFHLFEDESEAQRLLDQLTQRWHSATSAATRTEEAAAENFDSERTARRGEYWEADRDEGRDEDPGYYTY